MTCVFRGGRAVCGRIATHACSLCGDHVCAEHAAPAYHFNARRIA